MYPFPHKLANIMHVIGNTPSLEPKTPLASISQLAEGDIEAVAHDRCHGDHLVGLLAEANKETASFPKICDDVVTHCRNIADWILDLSAFHPLL